MDLESHCTSRPRRKECSRWKRARSIPLYIVLSGESSLRVNGTLRITAGVRVTTTLRQFGNTACIREQIYDIYNFAFLDAIARNLRSGVRTLLRTPGFAILAILILSLSIGAAGAVFSFVDGVFFKPLPYRDPSRIVRVEERRSSGESNIVVAPLNFIGLQNDNIVFEPIAARTFVREALSSVPEPAIILGTRVRSEEH